MCLNPKSQYANIFIANLPNVNNVNLLLNLTVSIHLKHGPLQSYTSRYDYNQGSQFKQATGDISGCGEVDRRL